MVCLCTRQPTKKQQINEFGQVQFQSEGIFGACCTQNEYVIIICTQNEYVIIICTQNEYVIKICTENQYVMTLCTKNKYKCHICNNFWARIHFHQAARSQLNISLLCVITVCTKNEYVMTSVQKCQKVITSCTNNEHVMTCVQKCQNVITSCTNNEYVMTRNEYFIPILYKELVCHNNNVSVSNTMYM